MKNTKDIWKIAVTGLILVICVIGYSFNTISSNESDTKASITFTSDVPTCGTANVASGQACPLKASPCETCPQRDECKKECPQDGPGCGTCPQLDECEKKCAQQVKAATACPYSKTCTTE